MKSGKFVILLMLLIATAAAYCEKRILKTDLPAAVQKTAEEEAKGATVRGYSSETENGQLQYEVEMISNGYTKDVTIAPDGRVLEIEEQLDLESLPHPVQSALRAKAGDGRIDKVESLTKGGALVAYEAKVSKAGKHFEVQVGPHGEHLKHEE